MKTQLFSLAIACSLLSFQANAQFGNLGKMIKKKPKTSTTTKNNSSNPNQSTTTSTQNNNTSNSNTKTNTTTNTTTTTQNNSSPQSTNNNVTTATDNTEGRLTFGQVAAFYEGKQKAMHYDLANIGGRGEWSEDFVVEIEKLDYPALMERMEKDAAKHPEFFMLYPKKLPSSGMGTITQKNLGDYPFASIASETAEPPSGSETSKFLKYYKEYCMFRAALDKDKSEIAKNLRASITKTENEHNRNKYTAARLTVRRANAAVALYPGDLRFEELKEDAHRLYNSTIAGFGKMITGEFHKSNLEKIMVFGKKPSIGNENTADIIEVIKPGQAAHIVGYFSATNRESGGLPSLLTVSPEHKYVNEADPWTHGTYAFTKQPMYNGDNVKEEFYEKAYFTFNLFPDIDELNYNSHVQYIPLMNFLKWLRYQPSEVIDIPLRYGVKRKMAMGRVKIDLTGDNKKTLDAYYKKLETKHLASVTFPDMKGCSDTRSKITNFSDLSKYGTVLKVSLSAGGNIMKPWPNDHEILYNTAQGFAAVEKSSGKVEIIPLDFRKSPADTKWQWWSVGSFPGLFPMQDESAQINAVKKQENGGYEIPKANVDKCSTWYREH